MIKYGVMESCSYYLKYVAVPSDTARSLYYYMKWLGHFVCRPDFYIKRSNLGSLLLLCTADGGGTLIYKGREYAVVPDSVVLIDGDTLHEYYPSNGGIWDFKYIHFDGGQSRRYYEYIYENFGPVIQISKNKSVPNAIDRLIELRRRNEIFFEIKVSQLIYQILTELIYIASTSHSDGKNVYVETACRYIDENYMRQISVQDIAASVNLSRCHFSTLFREKTGLTPYGYLTGYRIRLAAQYLENSFDTIEEIAAETGFPDSGTFIRVFKSHRGVTPGGYRKQLAGHAERD